MPHVLDLFYITRLYGRVESGGGVIMLSQHVTKFSGESFSKDVPALPDEASSRFPEIFPSPLPNVFAVRRSCNRLES